MNRTVTGLVATGALLSALASSPARPAPGSSAAAPRDQGQDERGPQRTATSDFARPPAYFAAEGRRDYTKALARLFLDTCREGVQGVDAAASAATSAAVDVAAAGGRPLAAEVQDPFAAAAFPGDPEAFRMVRDRQAAIGRRCQAQPADFIIALVPDPVHTRPALIFDRLIEVIQEASEDQGFHFVRALIPWDPKVHPESDNFAIRLEDQVYANARGEFPGLLTFRNEGDQRRHLFVLLVGESPTGGIEKRQFANAVDWIVHASGAPGCAMPCAAGAAARPSLRILGPTFSGSLPSLAELLTCGQGTPCQGPSLIFSGSATDGAAIARFRDRQEKPPAERFASFQESDEVMIERFIQYLTGSAYGKLGYRDDSVAILAEDETEYGADATRGAERLYLRFPREISRLRAAYQGSETTAPKLEAQSAPRSVLPPNLGISGADDDTVAAFSKQSPLSQEGVLLGIVSELRKHAVQFIVVHATDPSDLLFLSRYLAAAYPKGRIVTLGADLLFRREVEDKQLYGLLALSTYSVAPTANHEFVHNQHHAERLFPSSTEAGAYNALRALLTASPAAVTGSDPRQPFELRSPSLDLYQYGWLEARRLDPSGKRHYHNAPPVHLMALGRDEYWPIANLGPLANHAPSQLPRVAAEQIRLGPLAVTVPISWVMAELIALLIAFGFAASLCFASLRSPSQLFASFAPAAMDARAALIAASACLIATILLLLLFPFLPNNGGWTIRSRPEMLVALVAGLLAVLAATIRDLSCRNALAKGSGRRYLRAWPLTFFACAPLLLFAAWLAWHGRPAASLTGVWRFGVLRSLQLTSGLSPVLPMMFLLGACLWWAFHVHAGLTLLDDRRPQLPKDVTNDRLRWVAEARTAGGKPARNYIIDALFNALLQNQPSIALYLRHYLLPGALSALALLLLAAAPGVAWLRPLITIEARGFEVLLLLLFWLSLGAIIGTTLRLWEIWLKTRRLLVMLDSLPLRAGFARLKDFSWNPLWRFGLVSMTEFQRILAREREALHAAAKGCAAVSVEAVEQARQVVLATFAKLPEGARTFRPWHRDWHVARELELDLIAKYKDVQSAIAVEAGHALDQLAALWEQQVEKPRRRALKEHRGEPSPWACERFACLVYVSFLLVVLVRIRTLIFAIGGMYVLLVLAMTVYPFQPRASIATLLTLLLLYIIVVVTLVLAQLHRDPILSRVTKTTPGELGGDFWVRATSFAVLPVVTFLASQFPQVNRFLYSWLEPALQALNK